MTFYRTEMSNVVYLKCEILMDGYFNTSNCSCRNVFLVCSTHICYSAIMRINIISPFLKITFLCNNTYSKLLFAMNLKL
ncbi:hypothetical protein C1645_782525 [Glomus cerebriforme]|uniref:Uncharacterized protein n=1 Tax=Glomus cerebriforme TaxID=658196 RepID=A0A397SG34_9GLOM|nr:hypothetical protein C1645_782525 [Glomus cerebriforme]